MSKKRKKKAKTVQATLGDLVEAESKKKSTKKKASSKKKPATKQSTPKKKKTESKKAPKKSSKKPKKKPAKKTKKKAKKKAPPIPESKFKLNELPKVGPKLQAKLVAAGYPTVEQISRARASSLSKKVEGLSNDGAKKLVSAAKALVKKSEQKPKKPEDAETAPVQWFSLTDIPGVGKKLAQSLESAGYDSVARLSRSRPISVASSVEGLGVETANKLVLAARDLIQAKQLEQVTGVPATTVVSAKTQPSPKEKTPVPKKTKTATKPEKKSPTKKTKAKPKAKPKSKAKAKKKAEKPKKKAPARKKTEVIRKKSGLPVPEAVKKLEKEMKRKWKAARKRKEDIASGAIPEEEVDKIEATVEVLAQPAEETSQLIIETALEVLNETMMSGRPVFEIPSRSSDNIVWDEIRDLLLLGMRTISRPYHSLASVVDATRTARVMEIVYELLKNNLHATKREVYYSDVNLFRDQKYSDKIIEDTAAMLKTTRDSIHVVASARGSAMGRVIVRDGGDLIDLTKMGTGGWAITPFLDQVEIVESDAEYIIMSEKDAAVMRLAEAKYWNREPCIVLTGKGSGDIATRAFLRMLVKELEIPAFALVDSDPYGHYIYSVFLRGSKRLSYESPFIATPELKLLGVLSRDLDEYNIPKAVRIPMEPTDVKRVKDMLKEPFVQQNKEWVKDLRLMLQLKEKAEIQAFASHSFQYLTDEYLPRKLETADWI
jgi:DNA topoisomerase VI subunit A